MTTVTLHGEAIFTDDLAKLFASTSLTQAELAEKIGVGQSMVSRYIRGISDIPASAIPAFEEVITTDMIQEYVQKRKNVEQFPLEDLYELMKIVHNQNESGDINTIMGLRTLINLGETWYVLGKRFPSVPSEKRFGAAFYLALAGRTYGNERNYLQESFYNRFAIEVIHPQELVDPADCVLKDGSVIHPCEVVIEAMLAQGKDLWAWGPTGCGKSEAGYHIAERQHRNLHRVQGKKEFLIEEVFGKDKIKPENGIPVSKTVWGPAVLAAEEGGICMIDEITAIPPGYLFDFHHILDKKTFKWDEKTITPKRPFAIYATDNTTGQGEDELYIGTLSMNEALRDRFLFIEFGFMEKDFMIKAVTNALKQKGIDLKNTPQAEVQAHNMQRAVENADNDIATSVSNLIIRSR